MLYLILSICCSLAVASIFKYNETRQWNRIALLAASYVTSTLMGGVVLLLLPPGTVEAAVTFDRGLLLLVLITGSLFISTYFILAWATNVAGMGLATGVMRVSVVIPVLASWLVWSEAPSPAQGIGLLLATAAFFCIATRHAPKDTHGFSLGDRLPENSRIFFVLLLLFASGGIVDTCIKAFDEIFSAGTSDTLFLLLVYSVSAAIGGGLVLWRRTRSGRWPARPVLGWGILLGICNYGAALFFLRAVSRLPAPFVFPANSIALVLGAALIGVYAWGEKLSRLNWIGLGLAVIALVLLRF